MEKKLIVKMIKKCFKQYCEADSLPISEEELEELTQRILLAKEKEQTADLYELINDAVYEFLT